MFTLRLHVHHPGRAILEAGGSTMSNSGSKELSVKVVIGYSRVKEVRSTCNLAHIGTLTCAVLQDESDE
ncbi:uncharacterized protein ColSpa_09377 [Colletotrichum spaethianum]|uniref:Uncharacterized protein n=1 Tax=Colletotrichum spaethianum TaxID=700344 RepID=A0AA37PBL5_9PEZI|nr:uncharacterized protein ColSpa_09377 [Colletotrichum spaethianum]GKT49196.1 hypothetical protein ColSpa_09377 [Colletotrichum spaethianum]